MMMMCTLGGEAAAEEQTKHNFLRHFNWQSFTLTLLVVFAFIFSRRRSYPLKSEADKPIRFSVRSLGWVEIAEEDLTPERSSKAVNKCILDLSFGKNDLLDVIGRWGDVSVTKIAFHLGTRESLRSLEFVRRVRTCSWIWTRAH